MVCRQEEKYNKMGFNPAGSVFPVNTLVDWLEVPQKENHAWVVNTPCSLSPISNQSYF